MKLPRYKVVQGINVWYVHDNDKGWAVKTCHTRKEARRITVGMNQGRITDEVEKEASGDTAA